MDKAEKMIATYMLMMTALAIVISLLTIPNEDTKATTEGATVTEVVTEAEKEYSQADLDRMVELLSLEVVPSDADFARYDVNLDSMITISDLIAIRDIILDSDPYRCIGEFTLTAYCPCKKCCGKWAENRPTDEAGNEIVLTASGNVAKAGRTVAVDTSIIPFGTILVIDGIEYIAEDTGSSVKGNIIDIYFDRHEDAEKFGKQTKTVYIKEDK